jgi:hypothetical protein
LREPPDVVVPAILADAGPGVNRIELEIERI